MNIASVQHFKKRAADRLKLAAMLADLADHPVLCPTFENGSSECTCGLTTLLQILQRERMHERCIDVDAWVGE